MSPQEIGALRDVYDAVQVIQLTPGIRKHLEENDPKALAQLIVASRGLVAHFPMALRGPKEPR